MKFTEKILRTMAGVLNSGGRVDTGSEGAK
jgi:hypothetical protein